VDVRVVDVEAEPDAVLAQVADIAAAIRGDIRSAREAPASLNSAKDSAA
jgi:hypothetical protein